jgi:hypothetical protein
MIIGIEKNTWNGKKLKGLAVLLAKDAAVGNKVNFRNFLIIEEIFKGIF